ncbi:MAG: hypothetical protein AAFX44_17910 [Pseudomonadota bacterium]
MSLRRCTQLALLTLAMCFPLLSQAEVQRRPYWTQLDAFFESLEAGDAAKAVDRLSASSKYREVMLDELENVILQLASLERRMGKYHSHERLIERIVADRYAYIYMFVAYDRQPLKMEFHFYRSEDEWRFQNFSFSDKIDEDIVAAAQYELLNEIW